MSITNKLAYKPVPAGHNERIKEKTFAGRTYPQPAYDNLVEIMKEYLESHYNNTHTVVNIGKISTNGERFADKVDMSVLSFEHINSAIMSFQGYRSFEHLGALLTELYNKSSIDELVFDLETQTRLVNIGVGLSKRKKLLLRSDTDWRVHNSGRIVVNYGDCVCAECHDGGVFINFGSVKKLRLYDFISKHPVVINYGQIKDADSLVRESAQSSIIVNAGSIGKLEHCDESRIHKARVINQRGKFYVSLQGENPDTHHLTENLKRYVSEIDVKLSPNKSNKQIFSELRHKNIKKDIINIINRGKK